MLHEENKTSFKFKFKFSKNVIPKISRNIFSLAIVEKVAEQFSK